jgi:hypothetical protein
LEDLVVDGILIGWDVDWINLALERNNWLATLNTVMNFQVPSNFLSSLGAVSLPGILYSTKWLTSKSVVYHVWLEIK